MKSIAALALTLSAVTDATSLRARVKTLSRSELATVHQLAAKYDCRSAKGDLVETINSIVVKNNEEAIALEAECKGFNDANKQAWADATSSYDAQSISIPKEEDELEKNKVFGPEGANKVFESAAADWCIAEFTSADSAFSCTTYGTKVLPSKQEMDLATVAAESATDEYTRASAAHDSLVVVTADAEKDYRAEVVRLKSVADSQRDDKLAAATLLKEQTIHLGFKSEDGTITTKSATTVQTEEKAECTRFYDLRSSHISSDSKLLDEIKPLLEQLKICDTDGKAQADEKNTKLLSLLETSAQAKCAAANKKLQSFLEVSTVPVGSYEEFRTRVVTEVATMEAEKLTCDNAADQIFAKAESDANTLETNTHIAAEAAHEKSHKDYNEAQKIHINDLDTALETSRLACCDRHSETSKWFINDEAVSKQTQKTTAFVALRISGNDEMSLAYSVQQNTISTAADDKRDNVASRMETLENVKSDEKKAIDETADNHQKYCTQSKSDLVLEADTIAQMQRLINSGGVDGSGVRIVGQDRHSGEDFSPLNDEAVDTGAGDVTFDSSKMMDSNDITFADDINKVTSCVDSECGTNGMCSITHECFCEEGWEGTTCETSKNDCEDQNCGHGVCLDKHKGHECQCDEGWEGFSCDEPVDNCKNVDCNNGECVDGKNTYTCSCADGWSGPSCLIAKDTCHHNPDCGHGTCVNTADGQGHTCSCEAGWSGSQCTSSCEKNIGAYKDTGNRALRFGPHSYGYSQATCKAACPNYKYIALQNGGWCCCDNDLGHATKYGGSSCGIAGGSWCNYIRQTKC